MTPLVLLFSWEPALQGVPKKGLQSVTFKKFNVALSGGGCVYPGLLTQRSSAPELSRQTTAFPGRG